MIEVLFGDSEAGAMKEALRSGKLGTDAVCLGFALDVGDIKKPVTDEYRAKLLCKLLYQEQWGADIEMKRELKRLGNVYSDQLNKLADYLKNGEQIRIWYSGAPYSICGLMWLCETLREYAHTREIFAVKLPEIVHGDNATVERTSWGEVEPKEFVKFVSGQRRMPPEEILSNSMKWAALKNENAPLRAVINGVVTSVPANFYDFLIFKEIGESPVTEALLIGHILGKYHLGVGDYWYALRIEKLIERKRIIIIENSPRKYERLIVKNRV